MGLTWIRLNKKTTMQFQTLKVQWKTKKNTPKNKQENVLLVLYLPHYIISSDGSYSHLDNSNSRLHFKQRSLLFQQHFKQLEFTAYRQIFT